MTCAKTVSGIWKNRIQTAASVAPVTFWVLITIPVATCTLANVLASDWLLERIVTNAYPRLMDCLTVRMVVRCATAILEDHWTTTAT